MVQLGFKRGAPVAILLASLLASPAVLAAAGEAALAARLAKLERTLASRGLVEMQQQVDQMQRQIQHLQGEIEEQSYTIDQLRKVQRDSYVDIDQRLSGVEQGNAGRPDGSDGGVMVPPLRTLSADTRGDVAGVPAPQSTLHVEVESEQNLSGAMPNEQPPTTESPSLTPPPSSNPVVPTIDNPDSEVAYNSAFSLLKAGQYDESIAAFSSFLELYPRSHYADNAQYWLGETYYVRREFELAIGEYQKLLKHYPTSMKLSHAMLKIGYSYHELAQTDQARAVLEDLRNRFAGSTAARLAEDRIRRMVAENASQ
ncbi:MAG: tol-pal system protein YbgF [Gammaproteobacteria bacterium]|jgi:tol-pal system protein YbgF